MNISLIAAMAHHRVIGKNNQLPWHLPADLKHFKAITTGKPIIMGRKTYESMDKPLPGRINVVITRQAGWTAEGTVVAKDLDDALKKAAETNCKEIFIIGGGEIFKLAMAIADKIYLTRVHTTIDGDAFFPAVDENKWQLTSNQDFAADDKHKFAYSFQTWNKK